MLVAGFFIGPTTEVSVRRLAWRAMLILAGSVTGSAVWFTYVQKWVIGDFCIYCMSTHITGLLLAALVVWRATKEFDNHSNNISATNPAMRLFLIGLVLASVLAVSQISFTSPSVYSNGKSQDNLPSINYRSVPMIGSPDAPFVVNLLFDYECPHCQKLHLMLDEAIRRYGGKLAFVLCPTPLNTKCNPYITRDVDEFKNSCELAKIGLAVWVAKRKAFHDFDNWMYTFESGDRWRPRSLESARSKAIALVGKVKYDAALDDPWIGRYMQTCIRVYGQTIQNGNGGVPKLIFGAHWVIPEPNNADDLVRILQKSLGIPQP
jgi:thiol-disulfide isomerase/thioredoxin